MLFSRCIRVLRRAAAVSALTLAATAALPGAGAVAWAAGPDPRATNGEVLGWGYNEYGQVGDGTTVDRTTPVRVCAPYSQTPCTRFLTHVAQVSAAGGRFSLGLGQDGSALSWGLNYFGQLGDGTTKDSYVPVRVCAVGETAPCTRHLTGIHALAAGGDDGMALGRDGSVVAWGVNGNGELGDGTEIARNIPVRVCAVGQKAPCTRFLDHIRQVSPGGLLSLALRDNGTVLAWGWNSDGELGDGTTTPSPVPVRVCAIGETAPCTHYLSGVRSVAAGLVNSAALLDDGTVVTWGFNAQGELGDGTFTSRYTPVRVCAVGETAPCSRYLTGVHALVSAGTFDFALLSNGTVVGWGTNEAGQLGNDELAKGQPVPVRVCAMGDHAPCTRFLDGVRSISAAGYGGLATRLDDTAVTWGVNDDGQLGDGTTDFSPTPVRVCAPGQTAPCRSFLGPIRNASGGEQSLAVLYGG
jgi:alpha-tubulin suppressor-like RCC1 family protein